MHPHGTHCHNPRHYSVPTVQANATLHIRPVAGATFIATLSRIYVDVCAPSLPLSLSQFLLLVFALSTPLATPFFCATCALIDVHCTSPVSILNLSVGDPCCLYFSLSLSLSLVIIKNIYSVLAKRKVVNFLAQLMLACSASVLPSASLSFPQSLLYCPFNSGLAIRSSHFALMAKTKHLTHICEQTKCD